MYTELIDQTISQVYQKGVASKILQSMDRIRNEFDPVQARRWPTELLQNARDLAYPSRPVRVQIELTDDAVYFRHSGKPFSVKDILSIVNQVSSKKPREGVGQFGTGFMSTFQLSMKVDVRSLLKDEGEPYRTFHICLDRSGATHEAISQAIFQALESLKAADQAPLAEEINENAFNTEFCYHLDNSRSREIARIGVEDLRSTLAFIMLFSDRLGEAELLLREGGAAGSLLF
ncbi:MAG: ATP-binding protein, partial [Oscillospiraceae bacterium]|nr:ATP-binding protein [Oscillospiraceae bacterium]